MGQLYAFAAVLLFIVSHAQVKVLSHYPVEQVVFFRAFGILLFSVPILFYLKKNIFGVDKKNLFLRSFFGTFAIFLYFLTLQKLPFANAVVLQQMTPLFALLIAAVVLQEKNSKWIYLLFFGALIGIYLIKNPEFELGIYYFVGVISAFFAALAYNFIRKLKSTDHPIVVLTWFQYILLPTAVGVLLIKNSFEAIDSKDYFAIALLAVFSFLAQVCLTLAYQRAEVSKVSIFSYLSVPLSVLVGFFFFSEELEVQQFIGVVIIFLMVMLSSFAHKIKKIG